MTLGRRYDSYGTAGGRSTGATALAAPAPVGASGELPEYGQFLHFSRFSKITLEQRFDADAPPAEKPTGAFWVSHEPIGEKTEPYGWYSFCTPGPIATAANASADWAYPVVFLPGARVYVADSPESVDALEVEYGTSFTVHPAMGLRCAAIDWSRFARDWQALLVTRYSWGRDWLRGWDCDSAAVLDVSILRLLPPLTSAVFGAVQSWRRPGVERRESDLLDLEWERERQEEWYLRELEWEREQHSTNCDE